MQDKKDGGNTPTLSVWRENTLLGVHTSLLRQCAKHFTHTRFDACNFPMGWELPRPSFIKAYGVMKQGLDLNLAPGSCEVHVKGSQTYIAGDAAQWYNFPACARVPRINSRGQQRTATEAEQTLIQRLGHHWVRYGLQEGVAEIGEVGDFSRKIRTVRVWALNPAGCR